MSVMIAKFLTINTPNYWSSKIFRESRCIMYYPTFDEVKRIREKELEAPTEQENKRPLLPLYRDILADMETPVSAYCKTARGPYSFLLESVAGGERIARYSFIGINPYLVMTQRGDTATLRRARASKSGKDDIN